MVTRHFTALPLSSGADLGVPDHRKSVLQCFSVGVVHSIRNTIFRHSLQSCDQARSGTRPGPTQDVIEEAVLFLRHEIQARGVTVSLDLAPVLPRPVGDRTQLQQVKALRGNAVLSDALESVAAVKPMHAGVELFGCFALEPGIAHQAFDVFGMIDASQLAC